MSIPRTENTRLQLRVWSLSIQKRWLRAVSLYWRLRLAHHEWKRRLPYGALRP